MSKPSFYGDDLAHAHAQGFAAYWDDAVEWLAMLAKSTDAPAFAVDVGCGDGRMLAQLKQHGVSGRGFDIAQPFIDAALRKGVNAAVADATKLEVPEATLVMALGEVLVYENHDGEIALENIIQSSAKSLAPGGCLVFDLTSPEMDDSMGWRENGDWLVASHTKIQHARLERTIVTFRQEGDRWRRSDEHHCQRLVGVEEVMKLAGECGLAVERLEKMGSVSLLPGRDAYMLRKS